MTPTPGTRRQQTESLDESPQLRATEIAAMKRLEAVWRDFGGPPASDVFIEFGITVEEFYRRLHGLRGRETDPQRPRGLP
jgi:hypothetical protein